MKKIFLIILVALMCGSLAACQNVSEAKNQADYAPSETLQVQTTEPNEMEPGEDKSSDQIVVLHATIDGQTNLLINGATELTATAIVPDGMAVDYWELNGIPYYDEAGKTFTFTAQGTTVVDAKLHPEHRVTAINAEMQFLNANGKPVGDKFTDFVFEEDYEQPITHETMPGGKITVSVKAVVPTGYAIDYWLINGIPYYYDLTISNFIAYDLSEATVYEVVLVKDDPILKPVPAPVPEAKLKPKPEPTPIVLYTVNCKNCTYTINASGSASVGGVPEGTVITVTANTTSSVYWMGSNGDGDKWHPEPNSFTYKVNGDCSFEAVEISN